MSTAGEAGDPKARRTIIAVIVVFVVIIVSMIAGVVSHIMSTGSTTDTERPVTLAGDSFPVPAGATVSLLPAAGQDPPSSTRSWTTPGTLDQACTQWRDAFRTWVDAANQSDVSGSVDPGVACTFAGKKNGFDAKLRVAVYATNAPEANLTITDNNAPVKAES